MKYYLYILLFLIGMAASAHAQGRSGSREDEVDSRYLIYHPQTRKIPDSLLKQIQRGCEIKNESSVIGSRLFWENVISLLWIPID